MTEIWPKKNKICFQKKFEIVIIWPQNVSNGNIVGCSKGGGDGDGGGGLGGGSGGNDGCVVVMVVWW